MDARLFPKTAMKDPVRDSTTEELEEFLKRKPLGRMEEALQDAARKELKRRKIERRRRFGPPPFDPSAHQLAGGGPLRGPKKPEPKKPEEDLLEDLFGDPFGSDDDEPPSAPGGVGILASKRSPMNKRAGKYNVRMSTHPSGGWPGFGLSFEVDVDADSESEAMEIAEKKAPGHYAMNAQRIEGGPPRDEEGMTGEECVMTGDKVWVCGCPDCKKKREEAEQETDKPADPSLEEEMLFAYERTQRLRKQGIYTELGQEEPDPERGPDMGTDHATEDALMAELAKEIHILVRRLMSGDRDDPISNLDDDKVNKLQSIHQRLVPSGNLPEGTPANSPEEFEAKMSELLERFRPDLGQTVDLVRGIREEYGHEPPMMAEAKVQGMVKKAQGKTLQPEKAAKITKALIRISATLDKAGLEKSAYATLRTLQVLQKEIK
jgi:hypothetical protein